MCSEQRVRDLQPLALLEIYNRRDKFYVLTDFDNFLCYYAVDLYKIDPWCRVVGEHLVLVPYSYLGSVMSYVIYIMRSIRA